MDTFFPATIIAYIGYFAPYFPANNFIYFRAMMLAFMLLGQARKCVTNIASVSFFVERHISNWERFRDLPINKLPSKWLNITSYLGKVFESSTLFSYLKMGRLFLGKSLISQNQWDLSGVQARLINLLMDEIGDKLIIHGGYLASVDTTLVSKVQGKMPGFQKWHDHSSNPERGEHIVGHHWAIAALLEASTVTGQLANLCFPILANLISGNTNPLGFIVNAQGIAQVMDFWSSVCPLVAQLHDMMGK